MTTTPSVQSPPLEAARALVPSIRALAETIERERRLPDELVRALTDAGLFRVALPRELGGPETDPLTTMRVVEELARADGSVGWCALIASQGAALAGRLSREAAEAIFGDPAAVLAGTLAPTGRAVASAEGYRVSGRWAFASGIRHATWVVGHSVIYDGAAPRIGADGLPVTRFMLAPVGACTVLDTWQTTGLRGTGSHDFTLDNVVVPEAYSFGLADRPWTANPLYGCLTLVLPPVHGSHALGIAQAALDEVLALAGTKVPAGQTRPLREQAWLQAQVARAEALIEAARAFLHGATGALWDTVAGGGETTAEQRARVPLAAAHAVASAVQAVDLLYAAAGGTAIYARSPLDRYLRDIKTAAAHRAASPPVWEAAGRVALGLEAQAPFF